MKNLLISALAAHIIITNWYAANEMSMQIFMGVCWVIFLWWTMHLIEESMRERRRKAARERRMARKMQDIREIKLEGEQNERR